MTKPYTIRLLTPPQRSRSSALKAGRLLRRVELTSPSLRREEQVDTSLKTDEDEYVKPIIPECVIAPPTCPLQASELVLIAAPHAFTSPDIKVKIEVEPLEPSLTFESPDNPLRPWTFGLSILADYCSISRARLDKGFFRQRKQHGQDIPWSDILGGQQTTMGMHVSGNRADNAGPKCPGYPIMMLSGGDHFTKLLKSFELSLVKSAFFPPSHLIDARNDWRYYGEVQMVGGANASALRRFGPDDLRRLTRSEQKEWVHFTRPQKGQKGYSRKPIPEADYDGIIGRMTAQGAAWSLGYVLFECVGFNEEKLKIWEARRTKRLSFNGKQWPQKGSDEGVLLIAEAKAESKRYRQVYGEFCSFSSALCDMRLTLAPCLTACSSETGKASRACPTVNTLPSAC